MVPEDIKIVPIYSADPIESTNGRLGMITNTIADHLEGLVQ